MCPKFDVQMGADYGDDIVVLVDRNIQTNQQCWVLAGIILGTHDDELRPSVVPQVLIADFQAIDTLSKLLRDNVTISFDYNGKGFTEWISRQHCSGPCIRIRPKPYSHYDYMENINTNLLVYAQNITNKVPGGIEDSMFSKYEDAFNIIMFQDGRFVPSNASLTRRHMAPLHDTLLAESLTSFLEYELTTHSANVTVLSAVELEENLLGKRYRDLGKRLTQMLILTGLGEDMDDEVFRTDILNALWKVIYSAEGLKIELEAAKVIMGIASLIGDVLNSRILPSDMPFLSEIYFYYLLRLTRRDVSTIFDSIMNVDLWTPANIFEKLDVSEWFRTRFSSVYTKHVHLMVDNYFDEMKP